MRRFLFVALSLLVGCEEPAQERPVLPRDNNVVLPAKADSVSLLVVDSPTKNFSAPLPDAPVVLTRRDSIPVFARQFLGVPYIYAMSDPEKGFDCSGFIYYIYRHFGVEVPRSSIEYKTYGREVSLAEAQTADLILFTGAQDTDRIGHIGIILQNQGDSTPFIHASSGKEMAVVISSLAMPHYKKRFVKVVDVIGNRE